MTTHELLTFNRKLSDLGEEIEDIYHLILQLNKSKDECKKDFKGTETHRIYDTILQSKEIEIELLKKKYNDLINQYVLNEM